MKQINKGNKNFIILDSSQYIDSLACPCFYFVCDRKKSRSLDHLMKYSWSVSYFWRIRDFILFFFASVWLFFYACSFLTCATSYPTIMAENWVSRKGTWTCFFAISTWHAGDYCKWFCEYILWCRYFHSSAELVILQYEWSIFLHFVYFYDRLPATEI